MQIEMLARSNVCCLWCNAQREDYSLINTSSNKLFSSIDVFVYRHSIAKIATISKQKAYMHIYIYVVC